jgi:VWFA-related protein
MWTHRWIPLGALLVLCCVLVTASPAQQTPPSEGVIRINVDLVQVDAIVTDTKGKPVTNLEADDFEVFQDGKPQKITNFTFIDVKDSRVTIPAASAAPQKTKNLPAPLPPPPQLRREEIRRTVALVVDDLALSADSTVRVRQALKKWVDTEMQPGDLVAILRTSAGMGALQQFTADKRMLYAAIDLVQFHTGRVGVSSFAPITGAALRTTLPGTSEVSTEADTSLFNNEIQQAYMLGSIGAVQFVLQGLRDLPGRKSMVLFSENMKFTYLEGPGLVNLEFTSKSLVEERMRKLIDEANRSSVVIYAIDPRGVVYTGLTAEDFTGSTGDDNGGMTAQQVSEIDTQRSRDLIASQDGMITLTQKTGGLFLHNNDIQGSLREVVNDGDGYYLLGYQPDAATFDAKTRQPKYHSIGVRVKRPGLRVRSRSGFFGTPDANAAPPPVGRVAQIARALASPFASGSMRVQLTTLFSQSEKEGSYINAMFHFEARDLTFTRVNEGSHQAQFDTFAVTFDVDGRPVASGDKTWNLRVEDKDYEEVLKRGLVYSLHLPVKKPGAYQMRMVVRDSTNEQVGSATQFIEVPDMTKGRLTLSGIVLSGEQAQQKGDDPAEGTINADDPNLTAAVRIFKPGTAIVYAYQILNARADNNRKFQLEIQTRLFREGRQVYAGSPTPLNDEQKDPRHLLGAGRMQLAQAAPGHYALQVIVTDKLAKEKYRIAAQSMDFEVRQ